MNQAELEARLQEEERKFKRDVWLFGIGAALGTLAWAAFLFFSIPDLIAKL